MGYVSPFRREGPVTTASLNLYRPESATCSCQEGSHGMSGRLTARTAFLAPGGPLQRWTPSNRDTVCMSRRGHTTRPTGLPQLSPRRCTLTYFRRLLPVLTVDFVSAMGETAPALELLARNTAAIPSSEKNRTHALLVRRSNPLSLPVCDGLHAPGRPRMGVRPLFEVRRSLRRITWTSCSCPGSGLSSRLECALRRPNRPP